METTMMGYIGILGCIYIYIYVLGLYWDNGKENGSYSSNIGLYRHSDFYTSIVTTSSCDIHPQVSSAVDFS